MRNLGIVGHGSEKFTKARRFQAYSIIRGLLEFDDVTLVSGRSPMGGIDVWAEMIADRLGIPKKIFPAKNNRWAPDGFEDRNRLIAEHSDNVTVIVVKTLPPGFTGKRYEYCYHCKTSDHVKSGGCWTARLAMDMGKEAAWLEID